MSRPASAVSTVARRSLGVRRRVERGERLLEDRDRPARADAREVERLVAQQPRVLRVVARALGERGLDEREAALALAGVAQVRRGAAHELDLAHAGVRSGSGTTSHRSSARSPSCAADAYAAAARASRMAWIVAGNARTASCAPSQW